MATTKKTSTKKTGLSPSTKTPRKRATKASKAKDFSLENRLQIEFKDLVSSSLGKNVVILVAFLFSVALLLLLSGNLLENFLFMTGVFAVLALAIFIYYLYVLHKPAELHQGEEYEIEK